MFYAERQGFEPRVPRGTTVFKTAAGTTVFKTAAIDHSATSPKLLLEVLCFSKAMQRYGFFSDMQIFKKKNIKNNEKSFVINQVWSFNIL